MTVKITHVLSPEFFAGSDHRRRPTRAHDCALPATGSSGSALPAAGASAASGRVLPGTGVSGRVGLVRRLRVPAGGDQPDILHRPLTGGR